MLKCNSARFSDIYRKIKNENFSVNISQNKTSLWSELTAYLFSRVSESEKKTLALLFNRYLSYIRKISVDRDEDFTLLVAVDIFQKLIVHKIIPLSLKKELIKLYSIDIIGTSVIEELFNIVKEISLVLSEDDCNLVSEFSEHNVLKKLYQSRSMFGEKIKFNLNIDLKPNGKLDLLLKCINYSQNDQILLNGLKYKNVPVELKKNQSDGIFLDVLLKDLAFDMDVNLDQLVKNVKSELQSNKSNETIESTLFDLLGFSGFEVITTLLNNRDFYCKKQDNSNIKKSDIVDELINNPIAQHERRAKILANNPLKNLNVISDPSKAVKNKYPFVFDQFMELKEMGAEKVYLPASSKITKHHLYEQIYIPPSEEKKDEIVNLKKIPVSSLDQIGQMGFGKMKELNVIQSMVFPAAYGTNENLLICAPTGAGKTNIAMLTILHQIKQHIGQGGKIQTDDFKVIYVAPMKALAAEMTQNFSERLKGLGIVVKECTGDIQLSKKEITQTQMIVTTPEKYDVITRKSTGDTALVQLVKLLIIDEIHLLHEDRGSVIESLVARTLRQVESNQKVIRIVGLSATLPNYIDVAHFLNVNPEKGLFYFDGRFRPVPLHQTIVGVKGNSMTTERNMDEICFTKMVDYLSKGHQVMIFVHARTATQRVAKKMREMIKNSMQTDIIDEKLHGREYSLALKKVDRSKDQCLKDIFKDGLGCHHAGMLRVDRSFVEDNFRKGYIRVLVCTATLAWGVNLPAHAVIIRGTKYYDAETSSFQDIGILDVLQIFGRAGRPQFDTKGNGEILCGIEKMNHYVSLLTRQYPIESRFLRSLNDNLNAEVALGTVSNLEEATQWLKYTYLYVRMRKNPLCYGITMKELRDEPDLFEIRMNFIRESARQLDKARLIRFDERTGYLTSTDNGRLASHYYITYDTALLAQEKFKNVLGEDCILSIMSSASEFSQMKVRDDEIRELDDIRSNLCKYDIIHDTSDIVGKVNTIIQAYITRYYPESFSLVSDLNYVGQNVGRVARFLFEKAIRSGWAIMTAIMLSLCKVIERRLWSTDHPLWQFYPELSQGILSRLETKKLTLEDIKNTDSKEISCMIGYGDSGREIKRLAHSIPAVDVSIDVQPITRTILRVRAKITPVFKWTDRYHGTGLESFWVWVEDPDSDNIHYSESMTLSKKQVQSGESIELVFAIPIHEPMPAMYFLRISNDRWFGNDVIHNMSFKNLILPEILPPHTNLLDLRPLSVKALKNPIFESIYSFSHFNPIQTQIFHAIYHSDINILLGAPTGSGKTVAAELAIFRVFLKTPKKKCVYIAPLKALVRERSNEWKVKFEKKLGKKVVELTGDIAPDMKAVSQSDVIITTPEKWDGISRSWQDRSFVQDVALIVIDEIHLLGEDRGPVLEVIVSRTNFITNNTKSPVRVVGLSTALANARDLADWLHIDTSSMGLYNFRPNVRPVPLYVHIQGFPGRHYCPRMATMNKPAYQSIKIHSPSKPVLIFVSSRRQTRLTAFDLISYLAADMSPKEWINLNDSEIELIVETARDTNLKLTLAYGIGLHHAGLHEKDRKLVEHLFLEQKIQILIATSTLAWGVNFPAHLVVVKGTEYYDGATKRYIDYPITDVLQMMGRAGRPQFDDSGKAVIFVHDIKKEFYKKFLYEPFPVESSLLKVLSDHLNAEIVAGSITNKQSAMNYITWTFFFRRLLMNPNYYNLEAVDHVSINMYLSGLIERTIAELEESHCVEVNAEDNTTLEPGVMGRIASYYYLKHKSMRLFYQKLKPNLNIEEILEILSSTEEFSELPVRHNEDQLNQELSTKVPIRLNSSSMDSPHTKTNLLLQAHFSRLPLPIADYSVDTKLVLDQAIRVCQAMIDAAASEGYLATCLRLVHIIQMIVQAIWVDRDSPMLQLPGIEKHHLPHIKSKNGHLITSIPEFMDSVRNYSDLKSILSHGFDKCEVDKIYEILKKYPVMEIRANIRGVVPKKNKLHIYKTDVQTPIFVNGDEKFSNTDDKISHNNLEEDLYNSEPFTCNVVLPRLNTRLLYSWSGVGHIASKNEQRVWIPVTADSECFLDVRLYRSNYLAQEGIPKAYSPHFSKPKDEGYILMLGDPENQELHAVRRIPMIRQANTKVSLSFYTPEKAGRYAFRLYVMSDCYLSLDQEIPVLIDVRNC